MTEATPAPRPIRFQPGTVVATVGAMRFADNHALLELLRRHLSGDWGVVCDEDKKANEWALKNGARLLSAYEVNGEKLWIITEANRSQTTVMTPGEY